MTAFQLWHCYTISTCIFPLSSIIPIHTSSNMPMPGADKTTEAKEGVLTYMRAWGGTSLNPHLALPHTVH
ncbi:unnamed protein product [Aureobasidium uvarum]|uniref:Uncharacterized protein n=1 Tax=Aureobasidium uvarum TaxID=2773716 RepID=A0A9N8KKB8_9PEZI|nr:unnamed protein product [Aureobasidium uvarum]